MYHFTVCSFFVYHTFVCFFHIFSQVFCEPGELIGQGQAFAEWVADTMRGGGGGEDLRVGRWLGLSGCPLILGIVQVSPSGGGGGCQLFWVGGWVGVFHGLRHIVTHGVAA